MASQAGEKFSTEVDPEILSDLRDLAKSEGRRLQALVDDTPTDLLEKRKHGRPRAEVMAVHQTSHDKYAGLYKKLAK